MTARAIVLAAGRGTRMRRTDPSVTLDSAQAAAADLGHKALMPVGRPLLDHVLSRLADAGCTEVCIVVSPGPNPIRDRYENKVRPARLHLTFAVQAEPRGTADALLATESFANGSSAVMVNSDNIYPAEALKALAELPRAGLLGFRRSALLSGGNIPAERISSFALLEVSADKSLTRVVEKPAESELADFGPDPLISMNAWLLPPSIYEACRAVRPSPRGELELQDAVSLAISRGEKFQVIESRGPVLDLSSRADVGAVTAALRGEEVRL